MGYLFFAFLGIIILGGSISIYFKIKEWMLFKTGDNQFQRICKKCGAHQHQYRSNIEGCENQTWWSSVFPVGNDLDCKCHSYSQNREW